MSITDDCQHRTFLKSVRTPLADFLLMESKRGDSISRQNCPDGQFWLVSKGRWRFRDADAGRVLGPTDLAYSAPLEPCFRMAEERVVAFGVQVRGRGLDLFERGRFWLNPVCSVPWEVHRFMIRLMTSFLSASPDEDELQDQVVLLMSAGREALPDALPPAWLRGAREIIRDGEPASHSLLSIASAVGVSPAHLSSSFRHAYGVPMSTYRRRSKIRRALAYAADGRRTMNSAAIEAGFYDASHFHRACVSELGMEPSLLKTLFADQRTECLYKTEA